MDTFGYVKPLERTVFNVIVATLAGLSILFFSVFQSVANETWRGLTVAPENRCSPYKQNEYAYPASIEPRIVAQLGRIYSPYSDQYFSSVRETDIDHIVALSEAHDSGLCAADVATRKSFASDLLNLTLAAPDLNRNSKRGYDASEWMPPINRCWFADRIVTVRNKYNLTIDRNEADRLEHVLSSCVATELEITPDTNRSTQSDETVSTKDSKHEQDLEQLLDFRTYDKFMITIIVIAISALLIVAGLILLFLHNHTRHGNFTFKIAGIGKIETNVPALGCIVIGALLIFISLDFYRGTSNVSSHVDTRKEAFLDGMVLKAHAETQLSNSTPTEGQKKPVSGWVHLGDVNDVNEWNFKLETNDPNFGFVVRAVRDTELWKNSFEDLTGTITGRILGVEKPEHIGTIVKDSCVRLPGENYMRTIAISELWLQVERVGCP